MDTIIVAAGKSSRLYPLTKETPKCLLEIGGERLIERTLRLLGDHGINEVTVVVGFQHETIRDQLGDRVNYVLNPFYAETNNMASLWFALNQIPPSDCLYLHSDLIFDKEILEGFLNRSGDCEAAMAVDFDSMHEEAMKVLVENNRLVESSKELDMNEAAGEWIGMARFTSTTCKKLQSQIEALLLTDPQHYQDYDTRAFSGMADGGVIFSTIATSGRAWMEIDTHDDYDHAREQFGG